MMEHSRFVKLLKEELQHPLPGKQSQLRMSTMARLRELMDVTQPSDAVTSSVLILIFPSGKDNELCIALILRQEYEGVHSGQIALPGGRFEKEDINGENTALREAREEIGINPQEVTILGKLTDLYIPPSNYLVLPFVGFSAKEPIFKADPVEVDKIIIIHIRDLIDPDKIKKMEFIVGNGLKLKAPSYVINGHTIWGATAMILSEFKEIVLSVLRKTIQ
jgi:8-oxo-dGTP pyrophosphatase MutT (NUDIX family)